MLNWFLRLFSREASADADRKCQECAVAHAPEQPHDKGSLYYQTQFHMKHGRAPTWRDAYAHCAPATQEAWRAELRKFGVPEDQL